MLGRLFPTTSTARASTALLQAGTFFQTQTAEVHHHKERGDLLRFLGIHRSNKAKANRNTHVNEKMFRRMRGRKTLVMDLPDDVEDRRRNEMTPMELRMEMLKKGINPYKKVSPRAWIESQATLTSSAGVLDPYVQREETEYSWAAGQSYITDKWYSWQQGTRRIRKKEGLQKFDKKQFGPQAEFIYVQANKALQERNQKEMHEFVTELAFVKMWPDVEHGSIKWELVEWLSPSQVIGVRVADQPIQSGNDIAQLTVRMHSKQILAIYDRFGHLILGSETEPREVVEYVVFENHIAVTDSKWRLHEKVYPKWSKPKQGLLYSNPDTYLTGGDAPTEAVDLPLRTRELAKQEKEARKAGKNES